MRPAFLTAALLLLAAPVAAQPAGAPPASPPAAIAPTPRFYNPDDRITRRPSADVSASGAAVVSSADPRATEVGIAMLKAGGSAADAAIATMVALTVSEPQSSGIGGGAFLVWHDAKTGRIHTLDGRERAPDSMTAERFLTPDGTPMGFAEAVPGGFSVGVPGAVALAAEAHRRWGRLPWAALFEPSIQLARDGIIVTDRLHRFTRSRLPMLKASPAAAAIFLDSNGEPWPVGHRLVQPALAHALAQIAADGPDAFYRGPVGASITAAVGQAFRNPTALTAADLAGYEVTEREALCLPYRQFRICSMGPPSAGGVAVLQTLKQLERFDLPALGPDDLFSWHLFAESLRLAYADREAWGADPDHALVPVAGLVDPAYLAARSALIRIERAMPEAPPGTPPGAAPRTAQLLADVPATSHLAVADADGNIANLTSTIEGPFGSGLVASGFILNNQMTDFDLNPVRDGQPTLNRAEAGKRPRSSMAPTLVLDAQGRPIAAFGAAGGATIIAQVAKAIIAHLDWGMPVEEALGAPQLIADRRGIRYEPGTLLEKLVAGFKALGHGEVQPATLPLKGNALQRQGNGWRAAADPRSEGTAAGIGGQGR